MMWYDTIIDMAGIKEFEVSIPPHKSRIQSFTYDGGRRKIKIVDTHGVLDPADILPNGNKRMKEVTPSENGKRLVIKPVDESAKSPSNS